MTMKIKPWIAGLIVFGLFCIVSEMDYREAVHQEQIAKASQVQTYAAR
ncbi:MAG: hypothetical protein ACR2IJ_11580 [Fluviibacter sp.]|jgi:hypothetical protein